jgi:hypothetical protein
MVNAVVTDQRIVHLPASEAVARLPAGVRGKGVSVRIDRTQPAPGTATPHSERFPATWQARRARGQGYVEVGPLSEQACLVEVGLPRRAMRDQAELLRNRIEGRPTPAPVPARTARPRLRWAVAGVVVALVTVQLWTAPEPVTIEVATARYRAAVAPAEPHQDPGPPDGMEGAAPPRPPAPAPVEQPGPVAAEASEPAEPSESEEPVSAERPAPEPAVPEPGVYRYDTSGWEELSMPGSRRSFPSETAQTVTHTACGFQVGWQPLEERADTFELCVGDGRAVLASVTTYRSFFGNAHEQRFTCTEVPAPGGVAWSVRCSDEGTTMHVSSRLEERVVLAVDGQQVETVRVRMESRLEGDTSGTRRALMWFREGDGLLVRTEVEADLRVQGPFGPLRYREEHRLHLADLTARR